MEIENMRETIETLKKLVKENPWIASNLLKTIVKTVKGMGLDCYLSTSKVGKQYKSALWVSDSEIASSGLFDKEREANADLLIKLIDQCLE